MNIIPLTQTHTPATHHHSQGHIQINNHRPNAAPPVKKQEHIERATSPVDERILNQFYTDQPKNMHEYNLEGKKYVVYEGINLTDIESYRKGNSVGNLFEKNSLLSKMSL